MTNKHLLTTLLLAAAIAMYAQNAAPFKVQMGIGIGVLPTFAKDHSQNITIPLNAGISYRLAPKFALGAFGGYSASNVLRTNSTNGKLYRIENCFSFVGLRISAHTDPYQFDRWDLYGGMNGMFTVARITNEPFSKQLTPEQKTTETRKVRFAGTGFLGARYALTPHLGAWGEIGFGASLANCGLSYRFVSKTKQKSRCSRRG